VQEGPGFVIERDVDGDTLVVTTVSPMRQHSYSGQAA
jgi:hypothetical protein